MEANVLLQRLQEQKGKLVKAILLSFAKSIPVVGKVIEGYQEWEQELRTEEVSQKVERLAQALLPDETMVDAVTNASEQELTQGFAETVDAVPASIKNEIAVIAKKLAQAQGHRERQRLFAQATGQMLMAVSETVIRTRSSLLTSLHGNCQQEPPLAVGTILAGRFEILELGGSGGMGTIYKAYDRKLKEFRAVKTIASSLYGDVAFHQRFVEEIKLATKLSHPNILRVYDLCEDAGREFLLMEWIEGKTLRQLLGESGGLPWILARPILFQIANGLAFAHTQNVLHLDLKPENIMVDKADMAKIIDFGLARAIGSQQLVQLSQRDGTFGYMAPEQIEVRAVGKATDIYALAVVGYELVTGKLPLGRFALPSRYCATLPQAVGDAIMRALSHEPDERPSSVDEMLRELCDTQERPTVKQPPVAKEPLPEEATPVVNQEAAADKGKEIDGVIGCAIIIGMAIGMVIGGVIGGSIGGGIGVAIGGAIGWAIGWAIGIARKNGGVAGWFVGGGNGGVIGMVIGGGKGTAIGTVIGMIIGMAIGGGIDWIADMAIGGSIGKVIGAGIGVVIGGLIGWGIGGLVGVAIGVATGGLIGGLIGAGSTRTSLAEIRRHTAVNSWRELGGTARKLLATAWLPVSLWQPIRQYSNWQLEY